MSRGPDDQAQGVVAGWGGAEMVVRMQEEDKNASG